MATPIRDTPRDDLSKRKSNATCEGGCGLQRADDTCQGEKALYFRRVTDISPLGGVRLLGLEEITKYVASTKSDLVALAV